MKQPLNLKHYTPSPIFARATLSVPRETERIVELSFGVSERLCGYMRDNNMDERGLARLTGRRVTEVRQWLSGYHNFTLETLAHLETVLGVRLVRMDANTARAF